ncbi:MAG TPA: rRNA maturation RNase YbeY, partial [Terriglobales bacterium]|nr:rRNA maturation RNase YbeY [Terriglobales bacterium]
VFGLVDAFAGDVAISAEMAAHNARLLGHSPAEEIKILALHGMLHLAGYDHERDHGEMARTEERLRKFLRLPAGLIDRRQPESNGAGPKARTLVTTMQRKRAGKRVGQSASSSDKLSRARSLGKGRVTQVR